MAGDDNQAQGNYHQPDAGYHAPPLAAAAVAIRPPPFSPNKLGAYFTILEAQLENSNITVSATKFRHLLSNLPVDVVDKISNDQLTSNNYDELKKAITDLYAKPNPQIFNELLAIPSSLNTKPTIFLQQLRTRASQLNLSDDFLKIYFIQSMPAHVRSTLVTSNGSLEDLAKVADTLIDYNFVPYNSNYVPCNPISNVIPQPQPRPQRPSFNPNSYSDQRSQPNFTPTRDYTSSTIPAGIRAFHSQQKPRVCRSHLWFGHQARTCKPWCIMNNNSLPLNPSSRPSSRSSSPVRASQSGNA